MDVFWLTCWTGLIIAIAWLLLKAVADWWNTRNG